MKQFHCSDIRVRDIMSTKLCTAHADMSGAELVEKLIESNSSEVVVVGKDGNICGLLTKKRLMREFSEGRIKEETTVAAIMHSDVVTISPDSDILKARQAMRAAGIGRLPIVGRDGQLMGMLSAMQICNGFSEKLESIGEQLSVVLNTVAEGVIVIDAKCRVVFWNKSAEHIFAISARDILKKEITRFVSDACSVEVLATKKEIRDVYCVVGGRHLMKNASPIFRGARGGEVDGIVCTVSDITKLMHLMAELNLAKTQMIAGKEKARQSSPEELLSTKNPMYRCTLEMARRIAGTDASILILGESGTGKEVLSRAIHCWSPRKEKTFVTVNSAAIPESLCESEFFGYAPGAFTGASRAGQPGKFEMANKGTIFLDEIGELSLAVQAKLLRVLEYKTFYRVGGSVPISSDVRILAATNRDLEQMVREGKFREDLYYRLNVFRLKIPPLRERKEDILDLLEEFLAEFSLKYGCVRPMLDERMRTSITGAAWSGNIRELRNFAERMVVLGCSEWELLLGDYQNDADDSLGCAYSLFERADKAKQERAHIAALLTAYKNNKAKVAQALNIPRSTLYYKMKVYKIEY